MTYKISATGRLSIFGINQFPVSMFKDQWQKILVDHRDDILKILEENDGLLPLKAEVAEKVKAKKAEAREANRAARVAAAKEKREAKRIQNRRERLLRMLEELGGMPARKDSGE